MNSRFYPLTVVETCQETSEARSIYLQADAAHLPEFSFLPGQHLTLRFELQGEEHRRSYSLSDTYADQGLLRITVKRVKDGLISNHINDHLKAGDVVEAMAPFGGFYLKPKPSAQRSLYFFAGGSGITSLFSMLSTALQQEPYSQCYLLYGNKNQDSIIFQQALETLQNNHPQQLYLQHILSSPNNWTSWTGWSGWKGRADQANIQKFISQYPPVAQDAQYYICGPGGMNQSVKNTLHHLNVPAEHIHMESFGGNNQSDDSVQGTANAPLTAKLNGRTIKTSIEAGDTILQALRKVAAEPPYSCQAGVCSACKAKVTGGSVHMRARMALEDSEIDQGFILTCQSIPTSESLSIEYD